MRHLIDTYIEADEPRKISPFDDMSLLDLIVKTGIADAINSLPGGIKGNKGAIAETIANNVRSKIIKDHLNDPAFYDKMSVVLDQIIADLRAKRIDYEEYLKRIAELAKNVQTGQDDDTPEKLNTPGLRALYNNLESPVTEKSGNGVRGDTAIYRVPRNSALEMALKIDEIVKKTRPDGWRGVQAREQVIKAALHDVLKDVAKVERIFLVIKQQREY
jgi:type I restriction enzyme R subunit